jgi:hypothetical protein
VFWAIFQADSSKNSCMERHNDSSLYNNYTFRTYSMGRTRSTDSIRMPSSTTSSHSQDSHDACLLRIHGIEDEQACVDRLQTLIQDIEITKLEMEDLIWSEHLRDELEKILERRRPSPLKKITLRGGQGNHIPKNYYSLHCLCWYQIPLLPNSQVRYDISTLKELSLLSVSLSETFLSSLGVQISNTNAVIEKLDLTDSRILGRGLNILGNALRWNRSLQHLSLSECNLRDEELGPFVESTANHSSLSLLDMSFNKCRQVGVHHLSRMLIQPPHLVPSSKLISLNMGFMAFGSCREIDVSPIIESLCLHNRSLKILQLCGNNLLDDIMSELVSMLTYNHTLEQLDLSENQFTNHGISLLSEGLPNMKGLRYLDLQGNRFDLNGLQELADAISTNKTLEAIDVDDALSDSFDGWKMAFYLDLNWGGMHRLLSCQPQQRQVPSSLWPFVLARVNKATEWSDRMLRTPVAEDILFYFLKRCHMLSSP